MDRDSTSSHGVPCQDTRVHTCFDAHNNPICLHCNIYCYFMIIIADLNGRHQVAKVVVMVTGSDRSNRCAAVDVYDEAWSRLAVDCTGGGQ